MKQIMQQIKHLKTSNYPLLRVRGDDTIVANMGTNLKIVERKIKLSEKNGILMKPIFQKRLKKRIQIRILSQRTRKIIMGIKIKGSSGRMSIIIIFKKKK